MMINRLLLSVFCAALLASCTTPSKPSANSANTKQFIGWVDGNCFAVKGMEIKNSAVKDTNLQVISSEPSVHNKRLTIRQKTQAGDACSSAIPGRIEVNTAEGYVFYTLNEPSEGQELAQVIGEAATENLSASYCTTQEGINATVSHDEKSLWQGYYYLGYDLEPSC